MTRVSWYLQVLGIAWCVGVFVYVYRTTPEDPTWTALVRTWARP